MRPLESPATALLLLLLVPTLGVTLRLEHLGWLPYTLVRDLPWAGALLALLTLGAAVANRLAPARVARLVRASSRMTYWRAAGFIVLASATLLVALPEVMSPVEPGLTLRIGTAWRAPDPVVPPRRVERLSLGPHTGAGWQRGEAFTATLAGWIYAPLTGPYDFAVGAEDGAVLEVDGRRVVRYGRTPEAESQGSTSNPERGLHRGRVWLVAGLHRLEVASVHGSGEPRLHVRWIPPRTTSIRRIPGSLLIPDDATPQLRRLRVLQLGARRVGSLLLVVTGTLGLLRLLAHRLRRVGRPGGAAGPPAIPSVGTAAVLLATYLRLVEPAASLRPVPLAILHWGLVGSLVLGAVISLGRRWRARMGGQERTIVQAAVVRPGLRASAGIVALLAIQAILAWRFVDAVAGRLITSADHGAFIYRYRALARTFPRLISYDPWWNAGMVDESTAITGAALIHLLTWPLTRILPLETAYQWFIPLVAVVTIPWALYAATRLLGFSRLAGVVAALLAMVPADSYFTWLLTYGTLGALVTASLVPLTFVLAWRIFVVRDRRWWMVMAFATTVHLGLLWPLFPLTLLPALLGTALLLRRRLRRSDVVLGAGIAAAVLVLNASWLLSIPGMSAAGWVMEAPAAVKPNGGQAWRWLIAQSSNVNPLILVAGGAGLVLLPHPLRVSYAGLVGSLLVIAAAGPTVLPGMELNRFAIVLTFALVPVAAGLTGRQLRSPWKPYLGPVRPILALVTLLLIVVHVAEAWERYGNRHPLSDRRLHFMPAALGDVTRWLRTHGTKEARVFLAHSLEPVATGYLAHLMALTGQPMLARQPYNPRWGYGRFLTSLTADLPDLRSHLERLNVRYVVAGPDDAERWSALGQDGWLRLRASWSGVAIYETDITPTYLIGGAGTVSFDYNRIAITLDAPQDEVVLKFQWQPGLFAVPSLPIEPAAVGALTPLIRVRPGTVRTFEIRY